MELSRNKRIQPFLESAADEKAYLVRGDLRGQLKQALVHADYPAEDLAGYVEGAPLRLAFRSLTAHEHPFGLRDYQEDASDAFWAGGGPQGAAA